MFALEVNTKYSRKPFVLECFLAFQTMATFWATFEKFPLVPSLHFFRKCGFGRPCQNCHNLAIRAFLEPLFSPKSSPVFALYVHTFYRIMPFAPDCFWAFSARGSFWAIFEKFPLVPPLHFFRKCGFWVTLEKLP